MRPISPLLLVALVALPLQAAPQHTGSLSGQVVDAAGKPVAQARVRALPAQTRYGGETPHQGEARTDSAGVFRISGLRAGWTYVMIVDRGAFAPVHQLADVPMPGREPREAPPLRITVKPGAEASGRVVGSGTQPVEGATVRLFARPDGEQEHWSDPEASIPLETLSGADGRFAFPHLAGGRYDLQVAREGLAPRLISGLEVPGKAGPFNLGDIRLEPGSSIEGLVLDEEGDSIQGATVGLFVSSDRQAVDRYAPVETGPDGSFLLKALAAGERYDLWIQADGFVAAQAPGVEAPTPQPLRIQLRRAHALTVRVVDEEGSPVPRARLSRVEETRATGGAGGFGTQSVASLGDTDPEGLYRAEGLEPGTVDLLVQADGFQPALVRGVHVPQDKSASPVEIALARGGVLEGSVLDGDGKPAAGALVHSSLQEADIAYSGVPPVMTDDQGRYRLEGLVPGRYEVTVESADLSDRLWGRAEVGAGVQRLDFRFPAGTPVSGRVVDAGGVPVPRAAVSLVPVEGGDIPNTVSRADGTFTLRAVPDGVFRLRGDAPGFARTVDPGEVRVSGQPVEGLILRLSRGAAISGRLLGADPEMLAETRIRANHWEPPHHHESLSGTVDREGVYRVANATPGNWQVTAWLPDGRSASGSVEVGSEPVSLDLELPEGFTLSGRILLDGEPLVAASVMVGSNSSRTAYDGTFSVPGLRPGTHRFSVLIGPGSGQIRDVEMTRDREITVSLSTGRLEGRVLSPDGLPVPGAVVEVAREQPDLETSFEGLNVRTGEDGAFELSRCLAGSYRLRVHAEGFPMAEAHALVPPGGTVHSEIALETKP